MRRHPASQPANTPVSKPASQPASQLASQLFRTKPSRLLGSQAAARQAWARGAVPAGHGPARPDSTSRPLPDQLDSRPASQPSGQLDSQTASQPANPFDCNARPMQFPRHSKQVKSTYVLIGVDAGIN